MILYQALSEVASKNLARPAYHYLGKDINYGELRIRIAKLSYLYQHEIGHHCRVAFFTRNHPAVITSFFALTNNRSIIIPIDPDRLDDEIGNWIKQSQPTHLAVTSDLLSRAHNILNSIHANLPILELEKKKGGEYDNSYTPPPDNVPIETDPVLLLRTEGTAENPKLILFNHKQIHSAVTSLRKPYHIAPNDRILTTMNWAHPFALSHGMLFPLLVGCTCVIDFELKGNEFLNFLVEAKISRMVEIPKFLYQILLTCKNEQRRLPARMKSITVGLGLLSPELRKTFALMNIQAAHCYGQTENVWTIAMEDTEKVDLEQQQCICHGLAGFKYKVLDENKDEILSKGTRAPKTREGLLALTAPTIMMGYMNEEQKIDEKETKQAIRGTWLYTGDLARLEEDGDEIKVTFLGRLENAIAKDKQYILPNKIDYALRGVTGIQEAAGFSIDDTKGKKVLACAVVRAPKCSLNETQVIELCKSKLPPDHVPTVVTFTDFIPRTLGGCVNRNRLQKQFSGIAG